MALQHIQRSVRRFRRQSKAERVEATFSTSITLWRGHIRVRFCIIVNARIENVGKSQSCMVSKLPIIWKQTVYTIHVGVMHLQFREIYGHQLARHRPNVSPQALH